MISLHNQRIILDKNGTLTDISLDMNDYRDGSQALSLVTAQDKIYIGQPLPFANRHFGLGATVNAVAAITTVEVWTGTEWETAVDIIVDQGTVGTPFAASGYMSWKTDRDESSWNAEDDSTDITELSTGPVIYDLYWARISFSATLTSSVDFDFIGSLFSNDDELFSTYPTLNNQDLLDSFEPDLAAGTKTDWQEQSFMAAEYMINEMMAMGIAITEGQIMDYQKFNVASIHKVAMIAFAGLGGGYTDDFKRAETAFIFHFDMKRYNLDINASGNLERFEREWQGGGYKGR